jgi:EEF1A lysine methyltransferase 4
MLINVPGHSPVLPSSPRTVLRKGSGMFLYLTFGLPHFRCRHLTRTGMTFENQQEDDDLHYYLYVLRS